MSKTSINMSNIDDITTNQSLRPKEQFRSKKRSKNRYFGDANNYRTFHNYTRYYYPDYSTFIPEPVVIYKQPTNSTVFTFVPIFLTTLLLFFVIFAVTNIATSMRKTN